MNVNSRLKRTKRMYLRVLMVLLALILYYLVLATSFAFFTSVDTVTNRFLAKSIGLTLHEPGWEQTGQQMASAMEPGMVIPKDPYASNTGALDMVVRFKLTVRLGESRASLPEANQTHPGLLTPADDTDRKIAILRSLVTSDDKPFLTIEPAAGDTPTGNQALIHADNGRRYTVSYYAASQDSYGSEYGSFLLEAVDDDDSAEAFDLYLYYIGGNPIGGTGRYMTDAQGNPFTQQQTQLAVLSAGASTPRLFNQMVCPIYKKDYLTVFDSAYDVNVSVEGILLEAFDEEELPYTIENFKRLAAAE